MFKKTSHNMNPEQISLVRRENLQMAKDEGAMGIFNLAYAYIFLLAAMGTSRLNLATGKRGKEQKKAIEKAVFHLLTTKLRSWWERMIVEAISVGAVKEYDASRHFKKVIEFRTMVAANTVQMHGFSATKEDLDVFRSIIILLLTDEVGNRMFIKKHPGSLSLWTVLGYAPDERSHQFKGAKKIQDEIVYPENSLLGYIDIVQGTEEEIFSASTEDEDESAVYDNERRVVRQEKRDELLQVIHDAQEEGFAYHFVEPTGFSPKEELENWREILPELPWKAQIILENALEQYVSEKVIRREYIVTPSVGSAHTQRVLSTRIWGMGKTERKPADLPFKRYDTTYPLVDQFMAELSAKIL